MYPARSSIGGLLYDGSGDVQAFSYFLLWLKQARSQHRHQLLVPVQHTLKRRQSLPQNSIKPAVAPRFSFTHTVPLAFRKTLSLLLRAILRESSHEIHEMAGILIFPHRNQLPVNNKLSLTGLTG